MAPAAKPRRIIGLNPNKLKRRPVVKGFAVSVFSAIVIAGLAGAMALAAPPNITGNWTVDQSGANGTTESVIKLTQSGTSIVGTNPKTGTGFTGDFVTDTQINGKWHGPGGAGWLTVFVSPNGHSFNGTWGYNGRKANGSFVGNEIFPPAPITAAGQWKVYGAGGPTAFVGMMGCKQSGPSVVCLVGNITLNGKYRTPNKVRATWRSPTGTGWFSYWFNDDNQSFNGQWGYGADTSPPVGRVVGERVVTHQ
jgi:hypothetical protein